MRRYSYGAAAFSSVFATMLDRQHLETFLAVVQHHVRENLMNSEIPPARRGARRAGSSSAAASGVPAEDVHGSPERLPQGLYNRAFFRLFQLGNILQRQATKELGVSTVQWAVLGALLRPHAKEGMSFAELAEYLVVSRQNLDGVLKRLERDKHVVRVTDAVDRRARLVRLTPQGKQFWKELSPWIQEFYQQAMAKFRFDDVVSFVHFLNTLQTDLANVKLGK